MRKQHVVILTVALSLTLAVPGVGSQAAAYKPDLLAELTNATRADLAARARVQASGFPTEANQLALDLIFYRWAAGEPGDFKDVDSIIASLARALDDPTVRWAIAMFSRGDRLSTPTVLPPRDDERAEQLSGLRREYGTALNYARSSPVKAEEALIAALEICQELQLDISEAVAKKELGDRYFLDMHRYRQADICYGRALDTFLAYRLTESSATAYGDYAMLKEEVGNVTAAVDNYTFAAQHWKKLADHNPKSREYRYLAGREYMKAGVAQGGSTQLMEYGLDQFRQYSTPNGPYEELIENLLKVAAVYRKQGELHRAFDKVNIEARKACMKQGDPLLWARMYEELSLTYAALNDPYAEEARRKRKALLGDAAEKGAADLARLDKNPGLPRKSKDKLLVSAETGAAAYERLKKYAKCAEMWERIAEHYTEAGRPDRRIECLRSLAAARDLEGRPQKSLDARFEAVIMARKARNNALAAEIGREMVDAFLAAGDLKNAIEGFMELAPIFGDAGDVRGEASVLEARGELLAKNGQHAAAIEDFKRAREKYVSEVDDPWAQGQVSVKLAASQRALDSADEARDTLQTALDQIEKRYVSENLDPDIDADRSRLMMELYRDLACAYVLEGSEEKATRLLQRGTTYAWIPELVRDLRGSADPAVSAFASELDINVGSGTTVDDPGIIEPKRPLAENWGQFAAECYRLERQERSDYNALPIRPLDLLGQRESLPKDAVVIEYMPTKSSTYVFVCGRDTSIIRQIGIRSGDIEKPASELRKSIKNMEDSLANDIPVARIKDWQGIIFLETKRPLVELYAKLVAPIEQDLDGKKLLIFALPEAFSGLPMHALISSGDAQTPRFLVQDYEVSYLATGMLRHLTGRDGRGIDGSSDRLAIFADPQGNLDGARDEAAALERVYFNNQSYVGSRATVANFKAESQRASILHFAVHHTIDPNPGDFALHLAPDGDSDGRIGIEELSEIKNSHLRLVVLSACDSVGSSDPISKGPSRAAEIFSRVAGAKSVLGGLWKVSDAAASKIMVDFYRGLVRGQSRTEAIRRAQLEVIESNESGEFGEFAHPFYWACFALYGNPR